MTEAECVQVLAFLAGRCPSMRIEDITPRAWHLDLEEFALADCMTAARELTLAQPYVSLCDLYDATKKIADRRIGREKLAAIEAADAAETRALSAVPTEPVNREELAARLKALAAKGKPLSRHYEPTDPRRMAQARTEVEEVRKRQDDTA